MSGRRMKKLRKEAFKKHPEGSTLEVKVTKEFQGQPVAGKLVYGGYRRAYQDSKRGTNA